MVKGSLHSIQTLGAVDGPGLRTVVILQGCPMRCKFCHSVDTTLTDRGQEITVDDLVHRVLKNRAYWKKYIPHKMKEDIDDPRIIGGVTITGGDPVAQPLFTTEILKEFKKEKVHVVLETSLFTTTNVIDMFLDHVDLWMISIKHMDEQVHEELTGRPSKQIFENLRYLDDALVARGKKRSIRIRYVVIPGMTDDERSITSLKNFVSRIKSLEYLELLPYVTLGRFKWIELFGSYPLEGVPDASEIDMQKVYEMFEDSNLPILNLAK